MHIQSSAIHQKVSPGLCTPLWQFQIGLNTANDSPEEAHQSDDAVFNVDRWSPQLMTWLVTVRINLRNAVGENSMWVLVVTGNESILTGTDAAMAIKGRVSMRKSQCAVKKAKSNCKRERNFRYNSFNTVHSRSSVQSCHDTLKSQTND